ncbi:MAG: cyclopropane-fatty-acyl-phospholipid synthase family protein [Kangiellaceae bacterium]|nr:cyclopropane-fatty-acyl-phospholipid synthase family protein [Kangiellaceae bacterium]MCW9017903.1 cyclopropane-fatty-acyl-phospholipid synthase family protein [Kangiellaceae bacterium]
MSDGISVRAYADNLKNKRSTSRFCQLLKKLMFNQLQTLQFGELSIREAAKTYRFESNQLACLQADIEVLDEQFYPYIIFGGGVGAGEAYMQGFWRSNDLTKVIQLFALNQSVMDSVESGFARISSPIKKVAHWLNKNTHSGSKKNIVAHYDLGNEFFKLFLDPTMMYSSGIFHSEQDSMQQASINKLDRICNRLRLTSQDRVVEIGTGWGGFAIHAAKSYGCHVTTTTISEEQHKYAQQRIIEEGLQDKITLLKRDYRKLEGKYDKLVSIEMIEAVGHHYFNQFFKKCSSLLKPDGEMLLQAITITDQRFDQAKSQVDFIKRYIFPGSCIPSVDSMSDSIRRATDMRVLNLEDIGAHYARTLKKWHEAFMSRLGEVRQQGFSDAFIRMWEFYLCYCEGGFRERVISDVQLHLVKPIARVPETLPGLE